MLRLPSSYTSKAASPFIPWTSILDTSNSEESGEKLQGTIHRISHCFWNSDSGISFNLLASSIMRLRWMIRSFSLDSHNTTFLLLESLSPLLLSFSGSRWSLFRSHYYIAFISRTQMTPLEDTYLFNAILQVSMWENEERSWWVAYFLPIRMSSVQKWQQHFTSHCIDASERVVRHWEAKGWNMLSLACLDRITLFRKVDHACGSRKGKGFGFDGDDCMTHMNPSPIAPFNERQCIRVDQSPYLRNQIGSQSRHFLLSLSL